MNYRILFYTLGWILNFQAIFLLLPSIVALAYREPSGWHFLATAVIVAIVGVGMTIKKPKNNQFHAREGFVLVAISWILISMISAIPMCTSGAIPNYVDAVFEMVSGIRLQVPVF